MGTAGRLLADELGGVAFVDEVAVVGQCLGQGAHRVGDGGGGAVGADGEAPDDVCQVVLGAEGSELLGELRRGADPSGVGKQAVGAVGQAAARRAVVNR